MCVLLSYLYNVCVVVVLLYYVCVLSYLLYYLCVVVVLVLCVYSCTCCIMCVLSCVVILVVLCVYCCHTWSTMCVLLSYLYYVCIVVVLVVLCVYCCRTCTMCVLLYLLNYVCIAGVTLDAELLARSQYSEGPATGHLDTVFSWFPYAYKQMLRWLQRFQVATTCFSCGPPDLNLNLSATSSMFCLHVK